MARKPTPTRDDPEQSKRFIDMAREVGADESDAGREKFERAFTKVSERPKDDPPTPSGRRSRRSEKPASS